MGGIFKKNLKKPRHRKKKPTGEKKKLPPTGFSRLPSDAHERLFGFFKPGCALFFHNTHSIPGIESVASWMSIFGEEKTEENR